MSLVCLGAMMVLARLLRRATADCYHASELKHYENILKLALDRGYRLVSLREAFLLLQQTCSQPLLALRHDVDLANHQGDRMFFEIERQLGGRSTFYFRMGTWKSNRTLIAELLRAGFEVGYHYEEAAAVALLRRARTRSEVFVWRDEIQDRFRANCDSFRRRVCPDLVSVCSHGDWINRVLGFTNREFVDPGLLGEADIWFEAYDLADRCAGYLSDTGLYEARISDGAHWRNGLLPKQQIEARVAPLCLLTHERNWHPDWRSNNLSNLVVLRQRLAWQWSKGH